MLALAKTFAQRAEFALNVRHKIIAAPQPRKGKESFARRAKAAAKENDAFGFCLVEDVFIRLSTVHPALSQGYTRIGNFVPFFAEIFWLDVTRSGELITLHVTQLYPAVCGQHKREAGAFLLGAEDSTRIVRAVYYDHLNPALLGAWLDSFQRSAIRPALEDLPE